MVKPLFYRTEQLKLLYPYCNTIPLNMDSRDMFSIVYTTPACFSTFLTDLLSSRLFSSWKFFLIYLFVSFFANSNIDWPMNPCIPHYKVPHTSIIFESEVSITVLCLLYSPHYTAVWIKNCSKSTPVIKVVTMKNTMMPHVPVTVWNWSIHCPSLSAVFNLLHSSTNQELFEKHLCNKSSHYEK